MLNPKMEVAMNEQLNWELFSSYLYLSMAAYFKEISLNGFARWMEAQALEELYHGTKFYSFITERRGRVLLKPINGPATEWASPLAAFENALEHEQLVTGRINNLVNISLEIGDHASNVFLQWFVTEQVEEEASADEVIQKLKLMGDSKGALFMLDQELGQRTFQIPLGTTLISGTAAGA